MSPKAERWIWFAGFTAVFAVLSAIVFWGTWALDVVPVSPDDPAGYLTGFSDALARWWNSGPAANGKVLPSDLLWNGLIVSPWFCKELKYVSALFAAALAVVYFLRGRGVSRPAAYGGGMLLAFSGYWCTLFSAGHASFFIWMTYGLFSFGLIDRAVRKGKLANWLLLGLVEAWASQWQQDVWLTFAVLSAAWYVFSAVSVSFAAAEKKPYWLKIVKGTIFAALAFAIIGAASVRDAFVSALAGRDQQISEQSGSVLTGGKGKSAAKPESEKTEAEKKEEREARWIFVTNWSLPFSETAEFFIPRLNGDTSCPLTLSIGFQHRTGVKPYTGALGRPIDAKEGNYRQHSLYVGWYTCLFALVAVAGVFRRRNATTTSGLQQERTTSGLQQERTTSRGVVVFFAVAAVVFWLFSLGRYCEPVYRLVFMLPFGDYLRAPVKWHHVTEFCLAVLAGFGIEAAISYMKTSGSDLLRRYGRYAVMALVVYGGFALATHDHLYCAPVDMREACRRNCSTQMTVLRRQDFSSPQVQQMVQARLITSLANYLGNPDYYLVNILTPRKSTAPEWKSPEKVPFALGILSVIGSFAVAVYCLVGVCKRKRMEKKP